MTDAERRARSALKCKGWLASGIDKIKEDRIKDVREAYEQTNKVIVKRPCGRGFY